MYYTAHKQAVAAYEAEFARLKAVPDEQAQCAKVDELRAEIAKLASEKSDMQVSIDEAVSSLWRYANV